MFEITKTASYPYNVWKHLCMTTMVVERLQLNGVLILSYGLLSSTKNGKCTNSPRTRKQYSVDVTPVHAQQAKRGHYGFNEWCPDFIMTYQIFEDVKKPYIYYSMTAIRSLYVICCICYIFSVHIIRLMMLIQSNLYTIITVSHKNTNRYDRVKSKQLKDCLSCFRLKIHLIRYLALTF